MKVRLKDQYFRGRSKSNKLVTDDPILVSCDKYEQRKALKGELDNGSITAEEYDRRRTEICRTITRREASPIINMEIQHGDFVVMHGGDLQRYFEVRWNTPCDHHPLCANLTAARCFTRRQASVCSDGALR